MQRLLTGQFPDEEEGQSGFALIAVLLFGLVLAAVLAPLAIHTTEFRQLSANRNEALTVGFLVRGLAQIASVVDLDTSGSDDRASGAWWTCQMPGRSITIRIQDAGGLIDLNSSEESLLALGMMALGRDREMALQNADEIVRYRSPGGAGVVGAQPMRGAPFLSVIELEELLSLNPSERLAIGLFFTVYNRTGTVNRRYLDERLKRLLEQDADGLDLSIDNASRSETTVVLIASFRDNTASGILYHFIYRSAEDSFQAPSELESGEMLISRDAFASVASAKAPCLPAFQIALASVAR